ncbi:MAG: SagB/ThcOx family dehydrogenase [Thermodesulfobacteriota bacterium]
MELSAGEYHRKSGYERHRLKGHAMDWGSQPDLFKSYPGLRTVPLPQVMRWPERSLQEVLKSVVPLSVPVMNKDRLAQIVLLAHSLTAKARYSGADFYYRSVASAGALYPFELYAAVRGLSDLEDGLYHHSIGLHALTLLRSGNVMPWVTQGVASGSEGTPAAAFFLTTIFVRSSWKYGERAYRYSLLDTGHLAENLCLALRALELPFELFYDFDDKRINELLGVDQTREACLVVACVTAATGEVSGKASGLSALAGDLAGPSRVAEREADFPEIRQIHTASSKLPGPVQDFEPMRDCLALPSQATDTLPDVEAWPAIHNYAGAVFKRRSTRNFVRKELASDQFLAMLESLCPACPESGDAARVVESTLAIGFLSGSVQDLDPGFYLLDVGAKSISLAASGLLIEEMTHACMDQQWLSNSALHFLFLADLEKLETVWGPRGYRYAMLTAGRLGQRLYLTATSMQIGCCGIGAFYDDETAQVLKLGPHGTMLYLIASGPLRKWAGG